jgi:hypothetical protein
LLSIGRQSCRRSDTGLSPRQLRSVKCDCPAVAGRIAEKAEALEAAVRNAVRAGQVGGGHRHAQDTARRGLSGQAGTIAAPAAIANRPRLESMQVLPYAMVI